MSNNGKIKNVYLSDDEEAVIILDQEKLPTVEEYLRLDSAEKIYNAIFRLKVRGAPAIGICAAFGIYIVSKKIETESFDKFYDEFKAIKDYLDSSRPTAVNLSWALNRMEKVVLSNRLNSIETIKKALLKECRNIQQEDVNMCSAIAEYGLSLLHDGCGILTHCNAGPLATSVYGTALGPIFLGKEKGMNFHVFADETRPLLQGTRLTAYELQKAGVDITLICDNMAGIVMSKGWIDACFVGCDRVAANGDTANKIGTSVVAVLADYYNIPFYVLGPTSSIDINCRCGADISIELRHPNEISHMYFANPMAPEGVKCYNPAFDVTPNSLIAGIVTEFGIIKPPYEENIKRIFEEKISKERTR